MTGYLKVSLANMIDSLGESNQSKNKNRKVSELNSHKMLIKITERR